MWKQRTWPTGRGPSSEEGDRLALLWRSNDEFTLTKMMGSKSVSNDFEFLHNSISRWEHDSFDTGVVPKFDEGKSF